MQPNRTFIGIKLMHKIATQILSTHTNTQQTPNRPAPIRHIANPMQQALRIITILILLPTLAVAQQDPQFNHIFFNPMSVNPAYAGSQDLICLNAINKTQWIGFGTGAPMSTVVNVNAPIAPFGFKSGVGLNITQDGYGFNNDIGILLAYAARFKFKLGGTLAIGVNGGVVNNAIKPTWKFPSGGTTDVAAVQQDESAISIDFGVGLFYNTDKMFFGLSATHLTEPLMYKSTEQIRYTRQYYLLGGYTVGFANDKWSFEPSVIINTDLTTTRFSLNSLLKYNKKIWGGVSYRMSEAAVVMLGIEIFNGLRIGYAYEISTNKLITYHSGSHELMLGYNFSLKKEKAPQHYKSLRFL